MNSTDFLSDVALSSAVHDMLATKDCLNLAVAFWGHGAETEKKQTYTEVRIVCNLTMGGTNPGTVRKLIERFSADNVRQLDTLHAKVLIGDDQVIVSSANISTNGVGDDAEKPATWREAGYRKPVTSLAWSRSPSGPTWSQTSITALTVRNSSPNLKTLTSDCGAACACQEQCGLSSIQSLP
ncbi:MAG TPA: phospholipase D family protein [Zoogloea sp.]|jgi:hypothetical protein|nr:phospholipase D family protein [Zoogloea sp.]